MSFHNRKRGGVLMTVLIFSSVIAVSLTTYVRLATNAYQAAQRNFMETAASSLVEIGLEQALTAFNHVDDLGQATAFAAWTTNVAGTATLTLSSLSLGNGITGTVKVYVNGWNQSLLYPQVIAKATITPPNGPGLTRYVQVSLRRRSPFVGMLATGNLTIDTLISLYVAWNSLPNGLGGASVSYDQGPTGPDCFIGVTGGGTASFNNALIFGHIANDSTTSQMVHLGQSVLAPVINGTGWSDALSTNTLAIRTQLPVAPALPAVYNTVSSMITGPITFPRAGDLAAADGRYHYQFSAGAGINLSAYGAALTITAGKNCTFYLQNHSGSAAITLADYGGFTISNTASLIIYSNGNLDFRSWVGLSNANNSATSCLIYGTNPTAGGQTFYFFGFGGALVAAVNAPNADISWSGVKMWEGAVVGHNITFSLGGGFAYDTGTALVANQSGNGNYWGVGEWQELASDTQRSAVASLLDF